MHSPAIVHTGKDGAFVDGAAKTAVDAIFAEDFSNAKRIVLYFHGGLDNAAAGLRIAENLDPVFCSADACAVFFVWESGLSEILTHNLAAIAGEDFFNSVLKMVLKFTCAKLSPTLGAKAGPSALALPNNMTIEAELAKRKLGLEPFLDYLDLAPAGPQVTEDDQRVFKSTLAADPSFVDSVNSIYASILPEPVAKRSKGIDVGAVASGVTLMSPDVIETLRADKASADRTGAKGLLSSAFLITKASEVFLRVIRRFKDGRAHGVYPTVVEELLREFYVANVGAKIWSAMKGETLDTFQAADPMRGGQYFVEKLIELLDQKRRDDSEAPKITLVGHSTGAVFINHLLAYVQTRKTAKRIPRTFAFDNVILLAPAATFEHFAPFVREPYFGDSAGLYKSLRIFAMCDEAERQDVLVPFVYPRSLLYFVSGVLETGENGSSFADKPIIGMQRFYADPATYSDQDVIDVRAFVTAVEGRTVWSPCQSGSGFSSGSRHHGGFADDVVTRASLIHMIRGESTIPTQP